MAFPENYRIGVIADTHDRWLPRVAELFRGVDEIWHLGDVCREPVLDELRALSPRLSVVLGNNDYELDSPVSLDLERGEERFHLIHILPRRILPASDWLLFGHTHRPADEMHEGGASFQSGLGRAGEQGGAAQRRVSGAGGRGEVSCGDNAFIR